MNDAVYRRIALSLAQRGKARLTVALVPGGTPFALAREKLITHMLGRGIDLELARIDVDGDLAETLRTAKPAGKGAVLAYGLETVPRAEAEGYLRRSNFARARLVDVPVNALLVIDEAMWSWMAMELPDLVRWADGPFVLPALARSPHPLHLLPQMIPRVGYPLDPRLDIDLEEARGVQVREEIAAALARSSIVTLGGHRGVGVWHTMATTAMELASSGTTIAWPPNLSIIDGRAMVGGRTEVTDPEVPPFETCDVKPFARWLEDQTADVVFVPRPWSAGATSLLRAKGIAAVVAAPTSAVVGGAEAPFLERIYLPPVRVEDRDGATLDAGVTSMVAALSARVDILGTQLDAVMTEEAARLLARLSGGLPGFLWVLAEKASARAAGGDGFPFTATVAELAVVDEGRKWLSDLRKLATAKQTHGAAPDNPDHGTTLLVVDGAETYAVVHPLARLVEQTG